MSYNAADEEQVAERKRKELKGRELELDDMRKLLSMPEGRRLIWRYLDRCGVFRTSFDGSSRTYFQEGMRNVGLMLLADLNEANPQAYVQMLNEKDTVGS